MIIITIFILNSPNVLLEIRSSVSTELRGYFLVTVALPGESYGAGVPEEGKAKPAGGLREVAWELLTVICLRKGRELWWNENDGKSLN